MAFLIHDLEEILTIRPSLERHGAELPSMARSLAATTQDQFEGAVAVLLVGFVVAAWHGVRVVRSGRRPILFLIFAGALVANGVTHLLQALYFGGYVPGVVTAACVSLPYGALLLRELPRSGLVPGSYLGRLVLLGFVLQLPIALLALAAGRQFLP